MIEDLQGKDRETWFSVYNTAKVAVNPVKAQVIANNHVGRILNERSARVHTVNLDVKKQKGEILIRDEDGEYYLDAVLTGLEYTDGKKLSENLLHEWADYINENGLVGDVDHQLVKDLVRKGKDNDYIRTFMKNKSGIAKAFKAFVEDGELRIRTWIDKRYRKMIDRVKGLSLESFVEYDEKDVDLITKGDIFGFTFNVDSTPAYEASRIL